MANLNYGTINTHLYVARAPNGVIVGTWPAEGPNALSNPRKTISEYLTSEPSIVALKRVSIRKESHIIDAKTGALLTA
jgi:hypothetical protein